MEIENQDHLEEEIDEDEDWKNQMIEAAAENKLEEILLKKEVIEKEQQILEKKKILSQLREKHINYFQTMEQDVKERGEIEINQYQKFCIKKLHERIEYLQQRADKIKNEISIAKNQKTYLNDPQIIQFLDNIIDLLDQNKILEKYIRSETFRINQESILSLKYNFLLLQNKYRTFKRIRKGLEKSYLIKQQILREKQETLKKLKLRNNQL